MPPGPRRDDPRPVPPPWPAAAVFALLFACYAATACRTVGPGDSGELTVAMTRWGVAHAPGYPLLTLIGNLVAQIPSAGEPALALNLLSGLFAALACAALTHAVAILGRSPWAGAMAGLALGTSRVFWQYAVIVEVFALHALLAALLLLLLARFINGAARGRAPLWTLSASVMVMSGVMTHHTTLVLLALPALVAWAALLWRHWGGAIEPAAGRHALLAAVGAGIVGLLPLAYLPLAARGDPALNWGDPRDLRGLLALLSRQDFGSGWLMAPSIVVGRMLEQGEAVSPLGWRHLRLFWSGVPAAFGWVLPALAALGLAWTVLRARVLLVLVMAFLALLVAFFGRVNTPVEPLYLGITERFHILPHLVLAFLAGLGAALLDERLRRVPPPPAWASRAVLMAATGGAALVLHWREVDMSRNTFTRDFGANLTAGLPARTLLFSDGDLFANAFAYRQHALGRRPDLRLVDQPMMATEWYVDQLRRRDVLRLPEGMRAYGRDPATQSRAWLDLNSGSGPIAAVRFVDDTWRSGYRLLPMGLASEVMPLGTRRDPARWAREISAAVSSWETRSLDASYSATSWEAFEGDFYTWALAALTAARDMAALVDPAAARGPAPPALRIASGWTGARRADFLAWQAECWRTLGDETPVALPAALDSLRLERAMALARRSLDAAPGRLQALQTLAALRRDVPRYRDPRAELELREVIVRQRPGDPVELAAYLDAAARAMRESGRLDREILGRVEAVRVRYVLLLDQCLRLWRDPELERLRAQWSRPFTPGG